MTDNRTTWQDEIERQRHRLEADLVSRQLGVFLTSVVFVFFLPFWFVFVTYLAVVGSEELASRSATPMGSSPAPAWAQE